MHIQHDTVSLLTLDSSTMHIQHDTVSSLTLDSSTMHIQHGTVSSLTLDSSTMTLYPSIAESSNILGRWSTGHAASRYPFYRLPSSI